MRSTRIGTAGALDKRLGLRDLCAGVSCFTNSTFGDQYGFAGKIPPTASYKLLRRADEAAEKLGVNKVTIYSYLDEVRGKRG